jgi:hypothetical protein
MKIECELQKQEESTGGECNRNTWAWWCLERAGEVAGVCWRRKRSWTVDSDDDDGVTTYCYELPI